MDTCDVAIIGAGHNGLVCASYLAAAGLDVRVYERRSIVGGAAVTEEFAPGFRNSTASYTVSLLAPQVIADLDLHRHGLRIVERPIANFLPLEGNGYLKLGGGQERTQAEFRRFSAKDAERLPEYVARAAEGLLAPGERPGVELDLFYGEVRTVRLGGIDCLAIARKSGAQARKEGAPLVQRGGIVEIEES